jgi:hypothetical protein
MSSNRSRKYNIKFVHAGMNKIYHSIKKHLNGINKKGVEYLLNLRPRYCGSVIILST